MMGDNIMINLAKSLTTFEYDRSGHKIFIEKRITSRELAVRSRKARVWKIIDKNNVMIAIGTKFVMNRSKFMNTEHYETFSNITKVLVEDYHTRILIFVGCVYHISLDQRSHENITMINEVLEEISRKNTLSCIIRFFD